MDCEWEWDWKTVLWILGAITVIGIIVILVLVLTTSSTNHCPLSKTMPVYNTTVKNLFDIDKVDQLRVVANINGHVEYTSNTTSDMYYRQLNMSVVSISKELVTFHGDCYFVDIKYAASKASYNISKISLMATSPRDEKGLESAVYCINSLEDIIMDETLRFSCQKEIKLACTDKRVKLILKSLEFELGGDLESVKKGEFKKKVWEDSCSKIEKGKSNQDK